ncbi:MAG: bifunctional (p)ppGpp synthetase/guanosine-3',5'-bis(diphosphate) 3'-pyrophosphohydrolase, partial [Parcubacteria group bacterium]|nr:bifunctional (p)ppGpp synthetase/guanosine-3',5'-bis(diphosphate) 3'-pyrophosphohydrolase [Parcubacteria group bacterium]
MHDEAERGIAAHWAYVDHKGSKEYAERAASIAPQKELTWVNQLSEWQKEFKGSQEFIESLKIDFFKNRIFVITPKGDVIDLPEGSSPVDFAYHIHTDIGDQCAGARVNGKIVPLETLLKSGDVVEILVQKGKKPSEQWLEFVKTSFAKDKIRDALKKKRGALLEKPREREAEFAITVHDRVGLIRDISNVFSALKLNIGELTTKGNERYPVISVKCWIDAKEKAERLAVKLKKIKDVEAVSYKMK